jgi:excisionase family DNA binding protein
MLDELYDIPQICKALKISDKTCRDLIRSGALPTIRVSRMHRISKAALEAWIEGGGTADRYRKASNPVDAVASGPISIAI